MGQYYRPVLKFKKTMVYNRDVNGEYTMAKLTEHSWWENDLMKAISEKIFRKPTLVAWVGDYAENEEVRMMNKKMKDIWDCEGHNVKSTNFSINNLYLCNHDLKEYINMNKYRKNSEVDGWCLHPLSLLTAIGNGRGGGDYHDCYVNADKIGIWAWHRLSFEKEIPENYTEFEIIFKEN